MIVLLSVSSTCRNVPVSCLKIKGAFTKSRQDLPSTKARSIPRLIYLPSVSINTQLSLHWESPVRLLAILRLRHKNDLMHLSLSLWREPEVLAATVNVHHSPNSLDTNRLFFFFNSSCLNSSRWGGGGIKIIWDLKSCSLVHRKNQSLSVHIITGPATAAIGFSVFLLEISKILNWY